MRQVFVKQNSILKTLGGSEFDLTVGDVMDGPATIKPNELIQISRDLRLYFQPAESFHTKIDIADEMPLIGLTLAAGRLSKGVLHIALKNNSDRDIVFDNSDKVLLHCALIEKVAYRQIPDELSTGVVVAPKQEAPKRIRVNKKKKS